MREQDAKRWGTIPGVEVIGYVERLQDEYAKSSIVVVPVHSGGGTNIKVIEALSYGRPCVVTRAAARGYGPYLEGNGILVANDENEFVNACLRMISDAPSRKKMACLGWEVVHSKFTFELFRESIIQSLRQVLWRKKRYPFQCRDRTEKFKSKEESS